MLAASNPETHTPTPAVVCILVNWNGASDTLACLDSLALQSYPRLHILVIDNGSTDDSITRIRTAHPGIELIESAANLGFAGGNNLGLRRALALHADFVWLLNNDTIVAPGTCDRLVAKALAVPTAGIVGCVLRYMHDPTRIQAWGGGTLIPWLARSRHFTAPAPLTSRSYLTFASVLIRREVLKTVGLLDDHFFMYFEDVDYNFRTHAAGFTLTVAEDTAVLHREGGSDTSHRSTRTDRYITTSGLYFLHKHAPVPWLSQIIYVAVRLTNRILHGRWSKARAVLQGINDYHHR